MKFSRKLQKLFSVEALESLWEHARRWTHPLNAQQFLDRIDPAAWKRLRDLYPYRSDARKINQYDDAAYWMQVNVERVQDLWLDRSPPLRILDLGSGAGYFLYICESLGHEALGLDTDTEPLFHGTTALLNVRRVIWRINPNEPLPDLPGKFDLITAHRVCFNRISRAPDGTWKEWTPADWRSFIQDVRARFLKDDGRLLLDFNPRPDGITFFTPELRAYFLAEGARIFRSKALLGVDRNQRPRFRQTNKVTSDG